MIFQSVATLIVGAILLLLVYIWTSTYRGRELVQRYIDEVLEADTSVAHKEEDDNSEV